MSTSSIRPPRRRSRTRSSDDSRRAVSGEGTSLKRSGTARGGAGSRSTQLEDMRLSHPTGLLSAGSIVRGVPVLGGYSPRDASNRPAAGCATRTDHRLDVFPNTGAKFHTRCNHTVARFLQRKLYLVSMDRDAVPYTTLRATGVTVSRPGLGRLTVGNSAERTAGDYAKSPDIIDRNHRAPHSGHGGRNTDDAPRPVRGASMVWHRVE